MLLIRTVLVVVALGLVESTPVLMEDGNNLQKHAEKPLENNLTDVKSLWFERFGRGMLLSRTKRSLSLVSMVQCGLPDNCSRKYLIWYGSYCGPGGSGEPINDIDRCCQAHDACYSGCYDCSFWKMYFARHNWDCYWGTPYCYGGEDLCRWQLCACDNEFVKCLNRVDERNGKLC